MLLLVAMSVRECADLGSAYLVATVHSAPCAKSLRDAVMEACVRTRVAPYENSVCDSVCVFVIVLLKEISSWPY